jgi:LacI family transcriptional regulator
MKKTTIRDIAKIAGVSPRTVTRAFTDGSSIKQEKREQILNLCREYDYKPNIIASRLFGRTLRFGVCVETDEHISVFVNEIMRGFMSAKKELLDYKVVTDIEIVKRNNFAEIKECIEMFKSRLYDGIIINISPNDETEKILNETGIKIVCVNNILYGVNALFTILNDCVMTGKMACEMLRLGMGLSAGKAIAVSGRNNIALFTGDTNLYLHKTLKESFLSEAEKKGLNIRAVYDTKDTADLAGKYTEEMLKDNDINGIYISSANSVPIIEKIISAGKAGEIKIVASDIFPKMSEYIRNSTVTASIFQNPYKQAESAVMNLYYHLTDKRNIPKTVKIIPQIVMSSNIEAYENPEEK